MYLLYLTIVMLTMVWVVSKYKESLKSKYTSTTVGKVVGFVPTNTSGWFPEISPIIEYQVNGKTYRCIIYLLSCSDNQKNRMTYMNKEYTLYYELEHPNRVSLKDSIF